MYRKPFHVIGLAALLGLALACSRHSAAPTTPSGVAAASANDAGDGSTLKVSAPTIVSPVPEAKLDKLPVTLVSGASTGLFGAIAVSYHFQVMNPGGAVVQESVVGSPSYDVTVDLTESTRYTWRSRAEAQGGVGPWSATGSFVTPDKPKIAEAYIRGNELFDPLSNGSTIGQWNDVTFIPGVGVQLNSKESFVKWTLGAPLTDGEFSFEATNITNGGGDIKTKIMSMYRDDGVNVTDNAYRMTVDKRPNTNGWGAAVRATLRSRGIDAGEPNCGPTAWSAANVYLWRSTWRGGVYNITVLDGGVHGSVKKSCGTNYATPYSPNPHAIKLGSTGGRAGSETLSGVIIWNVRVTAGAREDGIIGDR